MYEIKWFAILWNVSPNRTGFYV